MDPKEQEEEACWAILARERAAMDEPTTKPVDEYYVDAVISIDALVVEVPAWI